MSEGCKLNLKESNYCFELSLPSAQNSLTLPLVKVSFNLEVSHKYIYVTKHSICECFFIIKIIAMLQRTCHSNLKFTMDTIQ